MPDKMYIVFYTNNHLATSQPFSNRLVTSQPFPTRTRQHGPDIHLTFIHHMTKESTNDDGAEEIRVVSHGDEHEPEGNGYGNGIESSPHQSQSEGQSGNSNFVQSAYFNPAVRSRNRWYETGFSRAAVSVPSTWLRRGIDSRSDMTIVVFDVVKKIRIENGDANDDKARKNHGPSTRDMP